MYRFLCDYSHPATQIVCTSDLGGVMSRSQRQLSSSRALPRPSFNSFVAQLMAIRIEAPQDAKSEWFKAKTF